MLFNRRPEGLAGEWLVVCCPFVKELGAGPVGRWRGGNKPGGVGFWFGRAKLVTGLPSVKQWLKFF